MQRMRQFGRATWLDGLVDSFQRRWETNPQYRAAVSGVVGLAMVLMMCACTGIIATAANAALAGFGAGSTNGVVGSADTGTGGIAANKKFPTATPPTQPAGVLIGGTVIPNSKTPAPGPTKTPVPTPTDTPTGGGGGPGGGGLPTTCNGGSHGGTWAFTPCPVVHGQNVTLTVTATNAKGHGMYVVVEFNQSNCTWLLYPTLDANGYWSYTAVVPDCGANSQVPLSGEINISGSYVMLMDAAPVQ